MSRRPSYNQAPCINKESVLLIGDAQVPFEDIEFIENVKRVAFAWGIRRCVWAGDMIDLHCLSPFHGKDKGETDDELNEDEEGLGRIAEGFTRIDWLSGNHENRLAKRLNSWLSAERIRKMLGISDIVKAHEYYYCYVGDNWQVEHPSTTSEIPARAAVWLAEKFGRNVVMFHNHLIGQAQTRDAKHWGIDAGMCADVDKMDWVALRHSKRPQMAQGAVILRWNGERYFPHHLTAAWTDWDFEIARAKRGKP